MKIIIKKLIYYISNYKKYFNIDNKEIRLEKYLNLVSNWKIDDHIYFDLNSNEYIYGRIYTFDDKGNISIIMDSITYKSIKINNKIYYNLHNSITNKQFININLIDKYYDIFNETYNYRLSKLKEKKI